MSSAVEAERGIARRTGAKTALKDVLARCIAEYNKMTTLKRHRIDSSKRALIYNLLLGCLRCISEPAQAQSTAWLAEGASPPLRFVQARCLRCEPTYSSSRLPGQVSHMKSWNPTTGFSPRRAGERKRATRARRSSRRSWSAPKSLASSTSAGPLRSVFSLQLAL